MGLLNRLLGNARLGASRLKDFGVNSLSDFGWSPMGTTRYATRYPGSDLNWDAEAGDLTLNATLSICLQYISNKLAVPDAHVVYEDEEGMLQPVPKHPAVELITWANPEYRGRQLLSALAISYQLNGNAYAVKTRAGGAGKPTELWYVPHWQMTPIAPPDNGPTQFYKFTYRLPSGATAWTLIPRDDVVHFRNGLDPYNPRLGYSPTRALLRSVVADNEIDGYTAVILRNYGVFSALVTPTAAGGDFEEITADQADALKQRIRQSTTGDARGDIIVPNIPVDVKFFGRSPQDLALDKIGDRPQMRLCAALGIDPIAVGLVSADSGKGGQYGARQQEARSSSYENCIMPMLSVFAEAWTQDLLPEFDRRAIKTTWVEYDYSRVRDLQEDTDAVHTRAQGDWKAGIVTLDEARMTIGLKPAADKDLGEKFAWQLLPAPAGDVGVVDPNNPETDEGATADADPDEQDLPEEEDEDAAD